jgi:hypothetical protein
LYILLLDKNERSLIQLQYSLLFIYSIQNNSSCWICNILLSYIESYFVYSIDLSKIEQRCVYHRKSTFGTICFIFRFSNCSKH